MIPDKIKANLPMIKALNEIKARNPMASGKRAAAFNLNNRRRGNKYFLLFLLLRAVTKIKEDEKKNCYEMSKQKNYQNQHEHEIVIG